MKLNINLMYGVVFAVALTLLFTTFKIETDLLIVTTLLGGIILSLVIKEESQTSKKILKNSYEEFEKIARDMFFRKDEIDKRINDALEKMQDYVLSESIYVGVLEENLYKILHKIEKQNSPIFKSSITKTIHNKNLENIIDEFNKKNCISQKGFVNIKNSSFRYVIYPMSPINSVKAFGFVVIFLQKNVLITDQSNDEIKFIIKSFAFNLSLINQKTKLLKEHNVAFQAEKNEKCRILNIYNQEKIHDTILFELARFKRYRTPMAIVLLQIDKFENFSNVLDKKSTNTILKELINIIKTITRNTDMVGKWDKNTFVIIASNIDYNGAAALARKLQKTINTYIFYSIKRLTCCYGVTSFSKKDDIDSFKIRAKNALEAAKLQGEDSIKVQALV